MKDTIIVLPGRPAVYAVKQKKKGKKKRHFVCEYSNDIHVTSKNMQGKLAVINVLIFKEGSFDARSRKKSGLNYHLRHHNCHRIFNFLNVKT